MVLETICVWHIMSYVQKILYKFISEENGRKLILNSVVGSLSLCYRNVSEIVEELK